MAATRIDDIRFAQTPDATEVVILFDGDLSADRYEYNVLGYDALKEQIIVHGIGLPFR
ncbi:MAG: hypothetical protein GWN87_04980, partial [Desulfuromonadales bacterium]|nr:hypothetical protein [Desulfuromonadales bacterium]